MAVNDPGCGKSMTEANSSKRVVKKVLVSQFLILLILLGSGAAFAVMFLGRPPVQEKQIETARLNVDIFDVQPVDFQQLVTGFGTVQPDVETIVAAEVAGQIVETHPQLEVGASVSAGGQRPAETTPSQDQPADVLVQLDRRDYQEQVQQAETRIQEAASEIDRLKLQQKNVARQLKQANAVLETLKEEYERLENGVRRQVSTPSELNRSLLEVQRYEDNIIQLENQQSSLPLQIQAAEQRLESARLQKTRAENDMQRTTITPPFDGVLNEVFVERGQFVRPGEPIVRLMDLSHVEVPVAIGFDAHLQLEQMLAEGTKPLVGLAANETSDSVWQGYLVRIGREADTRSRTVQVYVEVDNREAEVPLLPGAFVHARIDGSTHTDQILIPREALVNGSVFIVDAEGIARRRKVTSGRRFQSLVQIKSGLEQGDRVILTNLDIVEDGREVEVQSKSVVRQELETLRSPNIRLLSSAD